MLKVHLITLFLLLPILWTDGQIFPQQFHISVQKYGHSEGLSQRAALSLHRDSLGFMWIGTQNGLNRFDGHSFRVFTKERDGLLSNEVDYILEDAEGWFWLMSTGGKQSKSPRNITLFHPLTFEVKSLDERFSGTFPVPLAHIVEFTSATDKSLIFLTSGREVITWHPRTGFTKRSIQTDYNIKGIIAGSKDAIWGWGVNAEGPPDLVGFNWKGKLLVDTLIANNNEIASLIGAKGDWLQLIVRNKNLMEAKSYEINASGVIEEQGLFFKNIPPAFREDLGGKVTGSPVWSYYNPIFESGFFSYNSGLIFANIKEGWGFDIAKEYPELGNPTEVYFFDKNNFIIATQFGLFVLEIQPTHFNRYLHHDPSSPSFIQSRIECRGIAEITPDEIWLNTYSGTWRLVRKSATKDIPSPLPKLDKVAHALFKDSRGMVWVGVANPLIYDLVTHTITTVKNPRGDDLWAVYEDDDGIIWMSFTHHLNYFKDGVLQNLNPPAISGTEDAFFIHFHRDHQGKVWLASQKGLFVLNTQEKRITERFWSGGDEKHQIPFDDIYHIYEDSDGNFWLATNGGGLIFWDREANNFSEYTRANGLSSNILYSVYADSGSALWMSTSRGISRLDRETGFVQTFMEKDGNLDNEFNRISHFQASDGTIYFGSINGLTVFNPDNIPVENAPKNPPLVIAEFEQFDGKTNSVKELTQELQNTHTVVFRPNDRFFKLEFSLLSYINQQDVRYAYQFEGLDEDWNMMKENSLRVSHLPFGNYTLRVKGQMSNGHWSANELAIFVEVVRPFYLRAWFLLTLAALAFIVAWSFMRWRHHSLKKAKKQLEAEVEKATRQIQNDKKTIEKQAQDLRHLDQLKSRFFANVSHELRTPLTLILGPLHSALKKSKLDKNTQVWLRMAQTSANDLLQLVNSILDFSKLDAGKLGIQERAFSLHEELSLISSQFYSHAESKGIVFRLENEQPNGQPIVADLKKLKTILNNLLSNAIKFTPSGGEVVLRCERHSSKVLISVEDTGRGIHPEDIEHIFGRFYQSAHHKYAAEGGTGIGLALCRELTKMMNGTISVESEPGRGSRFLLELPEKIAPHVEKQSADPDAGLVKDSRPEKTKEGTVNDYQSDKGLQKQPAGADSTVAIEKDTTILVVEDNPDLRRFLTSILGEKYHVISAENGKVALDLLKAAVDNSQSVLNKKKKNKTPEEGPGNSRTIQLLISDVMMPVMDGLTLLRRLKSEEHLRSLPVIMLTARAGLEDKLKALRIGVDDYIVKPFVEEELLVRIENLLKNYRNRQQLSSHSGGAAITPAISEADAVWLEELEAIVLKELSNTQFTVTWLAGKLALSQRQLNRRLQQLAGMSARQYMHETRMHKARLYLEAGRYRTVSEVAYAVGFESPRAFSRSYQERFGRLPSTYF